MGNPHPQFTILFGQSQELIYPGEYLLTVEKNVNDKLCSEQILFEVHDLQNPQGIESYLINNGFYSVPIIINQSGLKNNEDDPDRRMSCPMDEIKFSSEFEFEDLDSDDIISDIVNNFKPFNNEDYNAVEVKSQNSCFCTVGVNELEDDFYPNPLALWVHTFAASEEDTNGKFTLKG